MNDRSFEEILVTDVGAPFLIGASIGYFCKKMLKVAMFIFGAIFIVLFLGEYLGVLTIHDNAVILVTNSTSGWVSTFWKYLMERIGVYAGRGASAVAGVVYGFKRG